MKRCVLMFGILLLVVIVASILEHKNSQEVPSNKIAMDQNQPSQIMLPSN